MSSKVPFRVVLFVVVVGALALLLTTRSNAATVTLSQYHSADTTGATEGSPPDGKISLGELRRVIELYNYRSGTTRTGQYHVLAGSEDGFAPGP